MSKTTISYKRHRFPAEIISHTFWLYLRFPLSLRAVEEILLERGIEVFYETLRRWVRKLGPRSPAACGADRPGRVWSGISTRFGSRCTAGASGSGAPWTSTASFWKRSCSPDATAGSPAIAAPAVQNRRSSAKAHSHRQVTFLCGGKAACRAYAGTLIARGPE